MKNKKTKNKQTFFYFFLHASELLESPSDVVSDVSPSDISEPTGSVWQSNAPGHPRTIERCIDALTHAEYFRQLLEGLAVITSRYLEARIERMQDPSKVRRGCVVGQRSGVKLHQSRNIFEANEYVSPDPCDQADLRELKIFDSVGRRAYRDESFSAAANAGEIDAFEPP
jgi:hypothetical protein